MQELTLGEVEEVSGALLPLLAFAGGAAAGAGLVAFGYWCYNNL